MSTTEQEALIKRACAPQVGDRTESVNGTHSTVTALHPDSVSYRFQWGDICGDLDDSPPIEGTHLLAEYRNLVTTAIIGGHTFTPVEAAGLGA